MLIRRSKSSFLASSLLDGTVASELMEGGLILVELPIITYTVISMVL